MPTLAEAVSDKPWSQFGQGEYTIEQWRRACLIGPDAPSDSKGDYSLPVKEPDGTLNRNGVHAAASRIGQVTAAADKKKTAAKRLMSLYRNDLDEEPPAALMRVAGMAEAAAEPAALTEHVSLIEATGGRPPDRAGRRMRIQVLTPGWGSSGYYSEAVLKRAADERVFGTGTAMYIDHQTFSEASDRVHGERSLKDLAARFVTDAAWDGKALVAEVESFGPWRPVLADMSEHVGVSIRALGSGEVGEAEGRTGLIVNSIDRVQSVDFVAEAGRGGKVLALLESARASLAEARNIGGWLESRLHCMFTEITDGMYGDGQMTRDERIALTSAISDALGAFTTKVEAEAPQLYQRDLYDGPPENASGAGGTQMAQMSESQPKEGVRMSGSAHGAQPPEGGSTTTITYPTGAPPAGGTPLAEAGNDPTVLRQQLAEAQLQLAQRADNARDLTEAKRELEEARRENLRLRADRAARDRATAALTESVLPEPMYEDVVEAVTGRNVPLTEAGVLDEEKLTEQITAAIERQRVKAARLAEAFGVGTVRGLGPAQEGGPTPEQVDAALTEAFRDLGLAESSARTAVNGRG